MFFFGGSGVDLLFVISGHHGECYARLLSHTAASGSFLYNGFPVSIRSTDNTRRSGRLFFAPNLVNAVQNNQ
jgi:hypothetical protein